MKSILKYLLYLILFIVSLILLIVIGIQFPFFQNLLSDKAENYLSKRLQTEVNVERINIKWLHNIELQVVYVEDRQGDTLLYAGAVEASITNWFLFKEASEIHYIRIKDAQANLHRPKNSEVWNYQFIIDAFATKKDKNKTSKLPQLDLKELELQQFTFNMIDEWQGSDMIGRIGKIQLKGDKMDLNKKSIILKDFIGRDIVYGLRKYSGGRPLETLTSVAESVVDTLGFNRNNWVFTLKNLDLERVHFFLDNLELEPTPNQFDGQNIDITGITLKAKDLQLNQDTLTSKVELLTAKERSGLEIKEMRADIKVSPIISELKNLLLVTNNSVLKDYYSMHYDRFPDFTDYITKVKMEMRLRDARVAMSDIAFFAPSMNRWKNKVYKGTFDGYGTVAKLEAKNAYITDGITTLTGNYAMYGLPEIETTDIRFTNGTLTTTYDELKRLFPEIKELDIEQLEKVNNIKFSGDVYGRYKDLTIDGTLATNLGTLNANKLYLDYRGQQFIYNGNISSDNFNADELFPNQKLGRVAFNLDIEGNGFDYKKNTIKAKGSLPFFDYNNYQYRNVQLDALVQGAIVKAKINSKDPNANADLNILIKNIDKTPDYDVDGYVAYIDLNRLGFTKEKVKAMGKIKANLSGTSLKNIVGEALLDEMVVILDKDTLNIDNFVFTSTRNGLQNTVTIKSNNLNILVDGTFYLDDLLSSVQLFLSYYIPNFVSAPDNINPNQQFTFRIQSDSLDHLIALFNKDLKITSGLNILGMMDGANQSFELEGYIPYIKYKNLSLNSVKLFSSADYTKMNLRMQTGQLFSAEKEMIRDIELNSSMAKDTVFYTINTTSSNAFGTAKIQGNAVAQNDSFFIRLLPSEVFFNNNKWDIEDKNVIVLAKDYVDFNNFNISSDVQKIAINTNGTHVPGEADVAIENINIRPILEMADMADMPIFGSVNGHILAKNIFTNMEADFDIYSDTLKIGEDTLGNIKLVGQYFMEKGLLNITSPSGMYDKYGKIDFEGTLATDSTNKQKVNFIAKGDNANLKWAEPFTVGLAKDLNGRVNGFLKVIGDFNTPIIEGKVDLSDGSFVPEITGVKYFVPKLEVDINSKEFIIKRTKIKDKDNNEGDVYGSIKHSFFSNLDFNLRMNSPNIMVLDLDEDEGVNFYGKVYSSATLSLRGPLDGLNMNITARPTANSQLYIPLTYGTDVGTYDYITFKETEKRVEEESGKSSLNIYIDAVASPDLETFIIIDPSTGEQINARGYGNITMFIPNEGSIRINGTYNIDEGYYDFAFKQMDILNYRKRFNILTGSSINWNGDMTKADVSVRANTIIRARLYDLIINDIDRIAINQSEISDAQLPQDVSVDLTMTGEILQPDLEFKLNLVEGRSIGTFAYQKLQRINNDENDLLNQVISLLLLDQFLPPEGINSANALNAGANNLSDVFTAFASGQITNFTNNVLGIKDIYVGVKYKNYNLAQGSQSGINYFKRNEAGLNIQKNFWNNRLVLDIEGTYDWGRSSAAVGVSDNIAGDFRLQYLINPSGNLRLTLFRNTNFDAVLLQNINRQGVGISYKKSFNNWSDFFNINKRKTPSYRVDTQNKTSSDQHQDTTSSNDNLSTHISTDTNGIYN